MECPAQHDDISILVDVTPCPVPQLPKQCWCGREFHYEDVVVFYVHTTDGFDLSAYEGDRRLSSEELVPYAQQFMEAWKSVQDEDEHESPSN